MIGVRTSRSCRRNTVTFIKVWPSRANIFVFTQGDLPPTSQRRTITSTRGNAEQQCKIGLQIGQQSMEWHFIGNKTNLVTGNPPSNPLTKKRQITHKYLPYLCDLVLPLRCFLVFSPAGKEQNTTEIRKLNWWGWEKETVSNRGN